MARTAKIEGMKQRGLCTTDEAWTRLKLWCAREGVTLQEGLDKVLMALGPKRKAVVAEVAITEPEAVSSDLGKIEAEEVEDAGRTVEQEPAPVDGSLEIPAGAPLGSDVLQPAAEPDPADDAGDPVAAEVSAPAEEPGWGASSEQPGLGAELPADNGRLKLNTKKLRLGLEGQFEEPLWRVKGKWQDSDGKLLPLNLVKALDQHVKAGTMELEVQ